MTNDFLSRYDKTQRLNIRKSYCHSAEVTSWCFSICLVIIMIVMATAYLKSCEQNPQPAMVKCNNASCHASSTKLGRYFERKGSKNPEEMAIAVMKTKSPRLLAAMAVVETDGNSDVRKRGYKKRHDGAFQVNHKHWGPVPLDATGQALQVERILDELVADKKNIKVALNYYGGDTRGKYANIILKELQEVPR